MLDVPGAAVVPEPERDVPLKAVDALEEILALPLALESTVEFVPALDVPLKDDVELTLDALEVVVVLLGASAEVADAGPATPVVEDACNSDPAEEFALEPPPAPAPDDDPPVAEGVAATVPFAEACT